MGRDRRPPSVPAARGEELISGGVNWPEREVGAGYFQAVQFFDDGAGWLVAERGVILYTSNGGQRWHLLDSGTPFALRGLSFVGRTEGWMAGDCATGRTTCRLRPNCFYRW